MVARLITSEINAAKLNEFWVDTTLAMVKQCALQM